MKKSLIFVFLAAVGLYAETFVAVLETYSQVLNSDDKLFVTDKVRSEARNTLPYDGFSIMTRENILQMLPPGKSLEDCEGDCLVETGKNISADYIAQARVAKVGSKLSVTVEIYSTANNNLLKSISDRANNMDGVADIISAHSKELFEPLLLKYEEEQAAMNAEKEAAEKDAAEKAEAFAMAEQNDAQEKADLAADAAQNAVTDKNAEASSGLRLPVWAKVIPYVLGAAALGFGYYENTVMDDEYDTYLGGDYTENRAAADKQIKKVDDAKTLRNVFYGVGAGLMAVGLTFTIVF